MSKTMIALDAAGPAASAAASAAEQARVRIDRLDEIDAIKQACDLFNAVWSIPQTSPLISGATLRALVHSGGYAFGAFDDDQIVGGLVGFLGWKLDALQLHSHVLGVSATRQGQNVGFALKQHQRAWALERGITTITWTFDPLVRRNAYFNITKLGASVTEYYSNFYGEMNDGINGHDETDRVLVEWQLDSPRATEASVTRLAEPDVTSLQDSGAVVALAVGDDDAPINQKPSAPTLLVHVPDDIVELRRKANGLARRWRLSLRHVLGGALGDGYSTSGMTRSGFYVLSKSRGRGERGE